MHWVNPIIFSSSLYIFFIEFFVKMLLHLPGKSAILSANMITRAFYTLRAREDGFGSPPERARKPQVEKQNPRESVIWIDDSKPHFTRFSAGSSYPR